MEKMDSLFQTKKKISCLLDIKLIFCWSALGFDNTSTSYQVVYLTLAFNMCEVISFFMTRQARSQQCRSDIPEVINRIWIEGNRWPDRIWESFNHLSVSLALADGVLSSWEMNPFTSLQLGLWNILKPFLLATFVTVPSICNHLISPNENTKIKKGFFLLFFKNVTCLSLKAIRDLSALDHCATVSIFVSERLQHPSAIC